MTSFQEHGKVERVRRRLITAMPADAKKRGQGEGQGVETQKFLGVVPVDLGLKAVGEALHNWGVCF